jgi:hypothetical protein
MPIKMAGRYDPGSGKDVAHRLLQEADVPVDHVYGVGELASGLREITFTHDGQARTAWAENEAIVHVLDGWDVLPPTAPGGAWRGGY